MHNNSVIHTSNEKMETTEERYIVDKETISTNLHKTIEEKDDIINTFHDRIKKLESTIKEIESKPFSPPKHAMKTKPKTKEIYLLTSPKTQKSDSNFVSINQFMKKRKNNYIKEISQNIYTPKLNIKFETITPRPKSPKSIKKNVVNPKSFSKSPEGKIINVFQENGGAFNHLSSIRERTKSVLDQYRQNNMSLMIKIRSMNNSEMLS